MEAEQVKEEEEEDDDEDFAYGVQKGVFMKGTVNKWFMDKG